MAHSSSSQYRDLPGTSKIYAWVVIVARALAAFLGGFSLLNLLDQLRSPGFDANLWWVDLRLLPLWPARIVFVAASLALVVFAVYPRIKGRGRSILRWLIVALLIVTLGNVVNFYQLLAHHIIRSNFPLPFSSLVSLALLLVLLGVSWQGEVQRVPARRMVMLLVFAGCLLGFPLAQIYCFGTTDYRRRADGIVVFGARAYANGSASRALADRVETACRLYHAGYAPLLIFSGGPGDGAVHETEAMRRLSVSLGVPENAMLSDINGLNTHMTVRNTCPLFTGRHMTRILAVSHFYHLARVKMTYQRAGWDVYTVPADEPSPLPGEKYLILREVAALWSYYLLGK